MIQEQAKLMLSTLCKDKKAFKNFYKKGYFSYSKDKNYKGEVAIVNKAIISFLEDAKDESKAVATVNFQDSGTFIYKLFGENYSFNQFGQDSTILTNTARVHLRKKEEVIQDIAIIRRHCTEAEEKAYAIKKSASIVAKLVQSDKKISSQDALILLQDTLNRLNQSRHLNEVEQTSELDR
jgi:hypothetical protein